MSWTRRSRKGSVFTMIMATVAMVGIVGVAGMNLVTGPITTASKVTHQNMAQNDLLMNAKVIVMNASTRPQSGDEDDDGYVEPAPFIPNSDASCAITLPAGGQGGCLPADIGAILTDPWGTQYAYCVWDHGDPRSSVNRIDGENSTSGAVLAIISAGPNKWLETPCLPYDGDPDTNDEAINPNGVGDDLVQIYTYAAAVAGSGGLWTLKDGEPTTAAIAKDIEVDGAFRMGFAGENAGEVGISACTQGSHIGRMRFNPFDNVIEVCAYDSSIYEWQPMSGGGVTVMPGDDIVLLNPPGSAGPGEPKPDPDPDPEEGGLSFDPVTDVPLGKDLASNVLTITGVGASPQPIELLGGDDFMDMLLIDGVMFHIHPGMPPPTVTDGQTIQISVMRAPDTVNTTKTLTVKIGADWTATWNITTINPPLCPSSPGPSDIGCMASDGAIYAGISPDGTGSRMFMSTRHDAGTTKWATPAQLTTDSPVDNCLSRNAIDAACTDGFGNTTVLHALGEYPAASVCRSKGANWYLPSLAELDLIYSNIDKLDGFLQGNNRDIWSSSESGSNNSWHYSNIREGVAQSLSKHMSGMIRCVRR